MTAQAPQPQETTPSAAVTPAELPHWQPLSTGSTASFRGLEAVSTEVAWVGGSEGTLLRTVDGGRTWTRHPVPDTETLQFRDIAAWDERRAVLMTAGQPARLYLTENGGTTFTLTHESPHPEAFFDSLAFWDSRRGVVMSDPVDGHLLLLTTHDGGSSWQRVDPRLLPPTLDGEAGFAASGTNVAVAEPDHVWVATGGQVARVFSSSDGGAHWRVAATPLRAGAPSKGIFSIAFRDALHGLAVGGDYQDAENPDHNIVRSVDGGKSWQTIGGAVPAGHRAAVVHLPKHSATTWLTVGRAGTELSVDDGDSWTSLGPTGFYTVDVAEDGSVWAAGDRGRVARLHWE